jgi:hypothetical protein
MATLTKKATSTTGTKRVAARKSATAAVIEHTFEDGTKFSGTFEQLEKVAKALGLSITGIGKAPKGYYMSESKGLVKISDMNEYHIRRALIKRSKDYFAEIFNKEDSIAKFLTKYTSLTEDQCIVDLYNELRKRS